MLYKRLVPKITVHRNVDDESSKFTSIITRGYQNFRNIGLPLEQVKILQSNLVDEITIVQKNERYFDYKFVRLIQEICEIISTPITVGGSISEWHHASVLFQAGVDKLILGRNKSNKLLATKISEQYGAQSLVYSLDYTLESRLQNPNLLKDSIVFAEKFGFGEILLNNISLDGTRKGLDLGALDEALLLTHLPVMIGCGVGSINHLHRGFTSGANAIALSTFLSQMDQTPRQVRSHLGALGVHIRMKV
jgi:imidazole glycerol-phosphate synthase subunit HisF